MVLALLKQSGFHPQKTRTLQTVTLGGTIILSSMIAAVTDPKSLGVPKVSVGFGMSEGLPICGSNTHAGLKIDRGAVGLGRALPVSQGESVEARVAIPWPEEKQASFT